MELIDVMAASPSELFWEGKARSVSSVNVEGPFDILPHHASFMTIVEGKPLVIRPENGQPLKFDFGRCVIYNHDNKVTIYTL